VKASLRIVAADDEELIRQYFAEVLPDLGHQVVALAKTGRELIEACRATQPDLVITDIKMAELDGIHAANEVNRQQAVPFILVSAFHDPDLVERARGSRIMAYLVKPIKQADLQTAIAVAQSRFADLAAIEQEARHLRQSLEDRKVIERAKGIMMRMLGLTEEEAFLRLQKLSWDTNRKLIDVARTIVNNESDMSRRRSK
jgi:response regulator NasT